LKTNALTGEELDQAVSRMRLPARAENALLNILNQSYQPQNGVVTTAEIAFDSPQGDRLMSALNQFGLTKAGDLLGYKFETENGSLRVTPVVRQEAAA
jgi:hypothetical protein